jgi:RNA polymerase sigma-70 factor, ECF subfamily
VADAGMSKAVLGPDKDVGLLDSILAGDTGAFEELVQRHEHRVYRIAVAITGNQQDAEEAMQDAFLKAYQHLGAFERRSKFSSWLTRIAVNEALQRRRHRQPIMDSLDDPTEAEDGMMVPRQLQDWHDGPEKIYSRRQLREMVERAIQSLPPIYREAFVLRDLEGLTTPEAAEALGLSVSALKSRVLRARLLVREALAARFQRHAPGFRHSARSLKSLFQGQTRHPFNL